MGKDDTCCEAHSLAEVYASLTGMPVRDRASADEALLFLANVRERLTIVTLTEEEFTSVLELSAAHGAHGIVGGDIYDGLLAHCALKAGADAIYT